MGVIFWDDGWDSLGICPVAAGAHFAYGFTAGALGLGLQGYRCRTVVGFLDTKPTPGPGRMSLDLPSCADSASLDSDDDDDDDKVGHSPKW
ncbi:hypothetical protein LZ31DRAFT_592438 [Colletotrichum somersetense]|nr:hypothetical protein LZ31DRAFT_592438 [Colletotrichum somersetense]